MISNWYCGFFTWCRMNVTGSRVDPPGCSAAGGTCLKYNVSLCMLQCYFFSLFFFFLECLFFLINLAFIRIPLLILCCIIFLSFSVFLYFILSYFFFMSRLNSDRSGTTYLVNRKIWILFIVCSLKFQNLVPDPDH